jgi:hypothetical protein
MQQNLDKKNNNNKKHVSIQTPTKYKANKK